MLCTRREFLRGAVAVSAMAGFGRFAVAEAEALPTSGVDAPLFAKLDRYAEQFLRESNSPGMTLVLVDRGTVRRVVTYGFSDLQRQQGIRADELFQIGSISKSFVAVCLLQLHREGRLDLHKPVKHYLPWLKVESKYAPITTHHLLTHTSGLPAFSNIFLTEPGQAHYAAYPPGERF